MSLAVIAFPFRSRYHRAMPESYHPVRYHPSKRPYSLAEAARERMLVVVKCTSCRRCVHFLASDLAEVLNPQRPALDPPCRCARCRTAEYIKIDLRQVHPGDVGKLLVRRPGKPRVVRDWEDVLL